MDAQDTGNQGNNPTQQPPKKRSGLGGQMKMTEEYQEKAQEKYQDRFQKRYEMEKKMHMNYGAEMDDDNGSIIRTSNK